MVNIGSWQHIREQAKPKRRPKFNQYTFENKSSVTLYQLC